MKLERINLVKYGFVRREDLDFNDDGNKFRCYEYCGMRVTYCKCCDEFYISAYQFVREPEYTLQYEEYSKLPHYHCLDALNGVSEIYETDIVELKSCIELYVKEYDELALKLTSENPTKEQLTQACEEILKVRRDELHQINERFTPEILLLSDYELKEFKYWYCSLEREIEEFEHKVSKILNTSYSRQFITNYKKNYVEKVSFGYEQCMEYLSKIK